MKNIIVVASIFITVLTAFGENLKSTHFETKVECEDACLKLLEQTETTSFSDFLSQFSDNSDTLDKMSPASKLIDELKDKSGKFRTVQKVGEQQLGDLYYKIGYLVMYEKRPFFYELVIIRTSKGYQPNLNNIIVNPKTSDVLEKIPNYCWK